MGLLIFNFIFLAGCVAAIYHMNRKNALKLGKYQNLESANLIIRMDANNRNMDISIDEKIAINERYKKEVSIIANKLTAPKTKHKDNISIMADYVK